MSGSQEALNRNHLAPSSLASSQLQLVTAEVLHLQEDCSSQELLVSFSFQDDSIYWNCLIEETKTIADYGAGRL